MSQSYEKARDRRPPAQNAQNAQTGADLSSLGEGAEWAVAMQGVTGNSDVLRALRDEQAPSGGSPSTPAEGKATPAEDHQSWFGDLVDTVKGGAAAAGSAIGRGASYIGDRLGDAFDLREDEAAKDAAEDPHPVTRDATEEDWEKLRTEVAAFEGEDNAKLIEATSDQGALEAGKTLSATEKRPDGMIEEMTTGLVNVPWEQFLTRVFPSDWGKKLSGYVGGEVVEKEENEEGHSVRQQERMVLETPMSEYLSWLGGVVPALKHLDMTKTEEIEYGESSARVRWRVYTSDNNTVFQDIGYVNFEAAGAGVKITFHSAHKYTDSYNWPLTTGPLTALADYLTANGLEDYFRSAIDHYRELAGG